MLRLEPYLRAENLHRHELSAAVSQPGENPAAQAGTNLRDNRPKGEAATVAMPKRTGGATGGKLLQPKPST
ncbi:hypothetical protein [Lysobacter sp. A289]